MNLANGPDMPTTTLFPRRPFLRAASMMIGFFAGQFLIDRAGLSFDRAIPFDDRAPLMVVAWIGACTITAFAFSLAERAAEVARLLETRVGTAVAVTLVVAFGVATADAAHRQPLPRLAALAHPATISAPPAAP